MNTILLLILTVLVVVWVGLFMSATEEDFKEILYAMIRQNKSKYKEFLKSRNIDVNNPPEKISKKDIKKIHEFEKVEKKIRNVKISIINYIPLMGYSVQKIPFLRLDANSRLFRDICDKYKQFESDVDAIKDTRYLLAYIISFASFAFIISFALSIIVIGTSMDIKYAGGSMMIFLFVFSYVYNLYAKLKTDIRIRTEDIESNFPKIMSKMALLTGAGMSVSRAWELTAYSDESILYDEMKAVVVNLSQNKSPQEAYGNFMKNCNSKYTTKLAMAMLQSSTRGNAEIITLFKNMNDESWFERRNQAKQFGEKAGGKLMIPMMMMFAGIIILVIVPAMSSMNM